MRVALQHLYDNLERGAKRIAKPIYRQPVITVARRNRRRYAAAQVIAVTGSSGKTTTKDLVHELLRKEFNSSKSDDTNNQIFSVARSLLRMRSDTQFLVQEVGASANADMNASLKLLQPNIGVVTTVGIEHRKAFRTCEAIAAEKAKLVQCLPSSGVAVLNWDDEHVREFASRTDARILSYGFNKNSDLRALEASSVWPNRLSLVLRYQAKLYECQTQFCGQHMTHCILAALATAISAGVSMASAIERLSQCTPTLGRMMPFETSSGIQFIRDDWKAPYWSIQYPIEFMRQATAERKIIILGTISDIAGTTSTKYRSVAENALQAADIVYFYGQNSGKALRARNVPEGKRLRAFCTFRELAEHLRTLLKKNDLVLLKASGGDHLARLAIMYEKNLACWRQLCQRENICDVCRLVSG